MKVLMLGWELPPYNSGGLGVACLNMAKALARRGAKIDFVLPYRAKHPVAEKFMDILHATDLAPMIDENGQYISMGAYSGCCVLCDGSRECEHAVSYGQGFVEATKKYAAYVDKLVRRRKIKPHVIHVHDWLTMEAGQRAKIATGAPLIVHVHATEFDRAGGQYGNPLIHEIEYYGLQMADRIIAVSQITKDIIVREYHIPADKVEVIHNSLDVEELARTTVETNNYVYAKELKKQGWTVVTSGGTRLTIQKGLMYMLEAAALALSRNPKILFLLGGDGEQRNQLIERAADFGISDRVIFTGFVRGARWRELYEVADIFVMSSVSEPFGITALEAAHYDNALLISKTSGAGEVLNNVMRFDYWDTRKLADEIVNVSLSPALRSELSDNVAREYMKFSWHDVAEKLLREYGKVAFVDEKSPSRLNMEICYA
ncbi:glycosyltransferase family 4 protein [Candidatus Saccharibacteria bacterium]|nr:glycosyltransferase family 4 protein [Candidatus Saccharibacteria bacterium]MCL1963345.1 glycosyltransferase family 4 protein [Candidatus Saccharibacteria bacterium]